MEWFYTGLGGIKQGENSVGFKNIIIRPEIVGDLKWVKSSYLSPYGIIRSEWKKENNILEMKVQIPANTSAIVFLATSKEKSVRESGKQLPVFKTEDGQYFCKVGSGTYNFTMEH